MGRISEHPIVRKDWQDAFTFTFSGKPVTAYPGEMLASALYAEGIRVFGHHPKDGAPQGIFCANGQCAQCLVMVNGVPLKACMTPAKPGMVVEPMDGLPVLPEVRETPLTSAIEVVDVPVLILGGGPAGMSAAIELGTRGIRTLIVDDKERLGGKLVLQTHRFFGSIDAVHAGIRGIDIGAQLASEVDGIESVDAWLGSTALAVFSDGLVGILRGDRYVLVRPEVLLVATGAREKSLVFNGNTLPGVYGAGAFQTLVNRDLVEAADRLFIVGGGNVGLIAGYHALQAGIEVVGLVEALHECGGYKVHKDKLARMGVPIYTSHTILNAAGEGRVESVTIARIDERFQPIPGTERSFACDTVLIAVGLDPVDEFLVSARDYGIAVHAAGDAEEIAEASAAIFSGKIKGLEIARALGATNDEVPDEWVRTGEILKSKPGEVIGDRSAMDTYRADYKARRDASKTGDLPTQGSVFPVFHCHQEIPCNPCTSVCPQHLIDIDPSDIRGLPHYEAGTGKACIGCERCITICPGLAITLVDYRQDPERPLVTVPFEYGASRVHVGDRVVVLDREAEELGESEVVEVRAFERNDRTVLLRLRATPETAERIAGVRVQQPWVSESLPEAIEPIHDETIVCRCERVTAGEIRVCIAAGYRDLNEIKAITRAGMGACGGKTCTALIMRLFREAGVPMDDVTANVPRPLFVEVPLGRFAGAEGGES